MRRPTQKVVCYVVRDDRLLVFRHIDESWERTGLQVPAGTIEPGESPRTAALREAAEETGLASLRVVRELGEVDYDMAPARPELQRRHVFALAVDGPVPERWTWREDDPADGAPPAALECFWIPVHHGHVVAAGQGALLSRL